MSHSVRQHLRVEIDAYDESIRRFIPGYEEGLALAAAQAAATRPARVLDLGAGTGALTAAVLAHAEVGSALAIDVDADMLAAARLRLAPHGARARFSQRSFEGPLPACDAVVASLALHHVPDMERKTEVYRRIAEALPPGGVFANADVTMPAAPAAREQRYRAWAEHMAAHGIDDAYRHFEEWSAEDFYFPLEDELAAMRAAGLRAECIWHCAPNAVLVGRKGTSD